MAVVALDSVVHYLVFALKWGFVILIGLNWRALPLVWHARVFWTCATWLLGRLPVQLLPARSREYLYQRMPIGQNPFTYTYTFQTSVGFSDADYNLHLSNSAYGKNFDYARMRAFVHWFPSLILNGSRLGLGASHYHFIKEIPIGHQYEIRVNIVAWEEKWIHLVGQFVTYPKKKRSHHSHPQKPVVASQDPAAAPSSSSPSPNPSSSSSSSPRPRRPNYIRREASSLQTSMISPPDSSSSSDVEDEEYFDEQESTSSSTATTPPTSAGSTSPLMKMGKSLGEAGLAAAASSLASQAAVERTVQDGEAGGFDMRALPPLPEGAVLHCVHVSSYCFKQNRLTVPPRVALVTAGFGDPAAGRAARVKEITDTLSRSSTYRTVGTPLPAPTHTIPELMRSEWKNYEQEGLWNLPEYEEQNQAALRKYRPLRVALDTLRL